MNDYFLMMLLLFRSHQIHTFCVPREKHTNNFQYKNNDTSILIFWTPLGRGQTRPAYWMWVSFLSWTTCLMIKAVFLADSSKM